MSNNPAKYEVLIKQYLRSILDKSVCFKTSFEAQPFILKWVFIACSLTCKSNHIHMKQCPGIRFETERKKATRPISLMIFLDMTLHRKVFAVRYREYENGLLININT